jgi:flagellar biosynthesis protein FliP
MAEMATTAFIFVAHDKASNRNKNKNFDRDLKLLCDLANFCVQPMLLVITGSFLCVSVVLQVGIICRLSLRQRFNSHYSIVVIFTDWFHHAGLQFDGQ